MQFGEQCDDGNFDNNDSCRNDCTSLLCGDGNVDPGETCDDGNDVNTDSCRNDCSYCGDGVVQFGESCDDGNDDNLDACRSDCTFCGDGIVQVQFGEVCDDGNDDDSDSCSNICLVGDTFGCEGCPPIDIGIRKKPWGRKSGLIGERQYRRSGVPSMRLPLPRGLGSR